MTLLQAILLSLLSAAVYAGLRLYDLLVPRADEDAGDGRRYRNLALGDREDFPFNLRWLVPKLVGENPLAWKISTPACLILTAPLVCWYLTLLGLTPWQGLVGVLLFLGLPGLFSTPLLEPVRVDAQSGFIVVLAACLTLVNPWLGLPLWFVAGFAKESLPIVIAILTGSWWPLVGLVAPLISHFWLSPPDYFSDGKEKDKFLPHARWSWLPQIPWEHFRFQWCGRVFAYEVTILPWGIVLPFFLLQPDWRGILGLAFGYALIFIASDFERVFQHAGLALIPDVALTISGSPWLGPLLLIHLVQPYAAGSRGVYNKRAFFRLLKPKGEDSHE